MVALVAWLASTSGLTASAPVPASLTFISPIGDPRLSLAKRVDNSAPVPGSQINYTLSYSNTKPGAQALTCACTTFCRPGAISFFQSAGHARCEWRAALYGVLGRAGHRGSQRDGAGARAGWLSAIEQLWGGRGRCRDAHLRTLVTSVSQPPPGQLRVTKTGYPAVLVNSQLVYVLRCENTGATTLADVSLVDVLPGRRFAVGASPPPNVAALPLLRWSLGDLPPGASRSVHRDGHDAARPGRHHEYGDRGCSPGGDDDDAVLRRG